jgi:hypothetical protein
MIVSPTLEDTHRDGDATEIKNWTTAALLTG